MLSVITEDVLEGFHASLQDAGLAASTRNQYVQVLKASFRWAARKGYLARSPISDDSTLKRTKVAQRRRRLSLEEETALVAAAGAVTRWAGLRLQWLIIARSKPAARRGELLALQWADVHLDKRVLLVRAVEPRRQKDRAGATAPDLGPARRHTGDGDDGSGGSDVSAVGVRLSASSGTASRTSSAPGRRPC